VKQGIKRMIEACIYVWSHIMNNENGEVSREKIVKMLKDAYHKFKVKPIKDYSRTGLYEREIITLYIVGKYGLNLVDEINSLSKVFYKEKEYDSLYHGLVENSSNSNTLEKKLSAEVILKTARFGLIMSLLGFGLNDKFLEVISLLATNYPDYAPKLYKLAKIYIAIEIAKKIAEGTVKNRLEKEALKQALCMKINSPKAAPSDKMIYKFAKYYFGVSEDRAFQVLNVKDSILAEI